MAKRPGRKAKEERKRRAEERAAKKKNLKVIVGYPKRGEARDEYNSGRLVIWAEVVGE